MTIVARPLNPAEPDLLVGHENQPLRVIDDQGHCLAEVPAPAAGWSHDSLELAVADRCGQWAGLSWNAYLAEHWIGSSEV